MARMYSRRRGKSSSTKPIKKVKPSWLTYTPKEIEQLIVKLAKTEITASKIGLILRDTYGVPDVKTVTNKKISEILKQNKLNPKLPEDLTALIKKHIALIKHYGANKHDKVSKRGAQLTFSKIRRLAKYYIKKKILPQDWKYDEKKAKLLIE
ncbi:MAG: 30S ribosomal protein S15 [archaeon]